MVHDNTYFMDLDTGSLYKRFIYDVTPEDFCTWYIRNQGEWKETHGIHRNLAPPEKLAMLTKEQFEFWDDKMLLSIAASFNVSMECKSFQETKTEPEPIKFSYKANGLDLLSPPSEYDNKKIVEGKDGVYVFKED